MAARHPRRPDHDRGSDQPTERCRVRPVSSRPPQGLKGWHLVNNQHVSVSLQKSRSSGRPSEWPTSGALRSHAAPLATAAPAEGLADKRRRRSPQTVVSPHPCRPYGAARPAERLVSTAPSRPSLIRMRPLVQVQPDPQNRLLTSGNAGRSASRWQPGPMHPVGDEVLRAFPLLSRDNASERPLCGSRFRWFGLDGRLHSGVRAHLCAWTISWTQDRRWRSAGACGWIEPRLLARWDESL